MLSRQHAPFCRRDIAVVLGVHVAVEIDELQFSHYASTGFSLIVELGAWPALQYMLNRTRMRKHHATIFPDRRTDPN